MDVSADDYRWLFEDEDGAYLGDNYCATLVARLRPHEVVQRLGATVRQEASILQVSTAEDLEQEAGLSYVAVTDCGNCTLVLENFSAEGYFRRDLLSRGTSVASHLQTVNVDTEFSYVRDGVTVLEFEPFYGDFRDVEDAELTFLYASVPEQ